MSDVTKKIAMFEQKNNIKPNNSNNINNNIKKKENKENDEKKINSKMKWLKNLKIEIKII